MYHRPLPHKAKLFTGPRPSRFHRLVARHSLAVSVILALTLTVCLLGGQLAQCTALTK